MVALRVSLPPTVSERLVQFRLTLVTAMFPPPPPVTVTEQVAVLPPLTVVTVMAVLPALIPITTPFVTVATAGLLLLHVTSLFVASTGITVADKVSEPPTVRDSVVLFRLTPVTATPLEVIVTVALQLLLVSAVDIALTVRLVAVSPDATVKSPLVLMLVPLPPPETVHVTVWTGLLLPLTSAINCKVCPFIIEALAGIIVTLVTVEDVSSGCQASTHPAINTVIMTDNKMIITNLLFIKTTPI
jgi:hypothetical protein